MFSQTVILNLEHFSASPDQHSNVSIQVIIKRKNRKDQGRRSYLQHEVTWKELHKASNIRQFFNQKAYKFQHESLSEN